MASSSPAAAAHGEGGAVCCMCGDHGLAGELFRCRCCRARLQHRYCSDLYPRAAAYRRCNWCLRAPAPSDQQDGRAAAAAVAADNNKPEEKRKTTASSSDEERRQRHEGYCSPRRRSSPPAELGHHPVKKKHRVEEKKPQSAAAAGKKEVVSTGAGGGSKDEEVMRAGTKARVNRVRVRRYKLLTEVISC
ncbi:unnamed protein product [Miscanthus lutarioriparius]|uniref:PHD-type zinc finger plants domain-containing protein n=1 Tax=Miscanthus lutarioriparius TaxID=422564 RepID=A0A811QSC6_9POAL|nr:unnamed protein product [Miscanthus lutarioriparius]